MLGTYGLKFSVHLQLDMKLCNIQMLVYFFTFYPSIIYVPNCAESKICSKNYVTLTDFSFYKYNIKREFKKDFKKFWLDLTALTDDVLSHNLVLVPI
ncbi:hypothetical protein CHRY9390_01034 [Chryseobacterium aquaeductus]|uniref:Uncharacterized protein n=1 Tax=Chryseobacterium aquaeductus TaxID=2675056 RepID=A0A9N8QQ97_9FLAO|nr:hypothetical protein CHRY9390_01034 [Chryseobacterium potabilaquae]CAD7803168.1 hypothetical protein CHRY9390_01034 [Chryseobacterium aquaeductus]